MIERHARVCDCSHPATLHDGHGCAAFLGAFAETAHLRRYCPCKRVLRAGVLEPLDVLPVDIVATVEVRERRGAAIAVCDMPPALELGPSADAVLGAVKAKLRAALPAFPDGARPRLRIVYGDTGRKKVFVEPLR
jgi:hypothetical protein